MYMYICVYCTCISTSTYTYTCIYVYMHMYVCMSALPATPVAQIAGRPANSNPRAFIEERCEGVSRWPMRQPGADSSAEVGLQRSASM